MHDIVASTLAEMEVTNQIFEDHFSRAEKLDFFVAEQSLVDYPKSVQAKNDLSKLEDLSDLAKTAILASAFVQNNKELVENFEADTGETFGENPATQDNSHQTSSLRL
ncbi:hypothetical protein ACO0RG_002905 [Hanseniaspora osmophila]